MPNSVDSRPKLQYPCIFNRKSSLHDRQSSPAGTWSGSNGKYARFGLPSGAALEHDWEPHTDPDRGWSGIRCRSPASGACTPGRHAAPRISGSPVRNTVLAASAERTDTETAVIRAQIHRTPARPVEIGGPGGLSVAPIVPTCSRERSACRLRGSSRRSTRLRHFASGKLNRRIGVDTCAPQHQHAPLFAPNAPPVSVHPKNAARPRFRGMRRRSLDESRAAAQLSSQRAARIALHSTLACHALPAEFSDEQDSPPHDPGE